MNSADQPEPSRNKDLAAEKDPMPAMVPWAVLLMIVFSFSHTSLSMQNKSATYDEPQHYRYGLQILLEQNSERFDDSKMPFSVLNGLPRAAALGLQKLLDLDEPPPFLYGMKTGRYATILVFSLLCFYVYRWSSSLYGWKGGLLSLFLCIFSPNLIAHARLITTDIFAATTITISLFYFWNMYRSPSLGNVAKSSLALGAAQLGKYSSVFLFPILIMIALVKVLSPGKDDADKGPDAHRLHRLSIHGGAVLLHFIAVLLAVNIGFLGNQSGKPLKDYQFQSSFFQKIQAAAGAAGALPLPVPYPYLQGLDLVKHTDGNLANNAVLLGKEKSPPDRFGNYYLFAFLYKVPIAVQILLCWALLLLLKSWRRIRFLDNELFLLLPAAFLAAYFNFNLATQIGVRFILPLLPLAHILCGALMSGGGRRRVALLATLCGYLAVSVFSWFPHYISYFNELVPDRKMSYKILSDSNIDFGQNEFYLEEYRASHPEALFHPAHPVAGRVVVGANFVSHVFPNSDYRWLRDNFTPVGHVGYSHLIFDISPEDLKEIDPSRVEFFNDPHSPASTIGNDYYRLNNWQGYGLELAGELGEAELHYRKLVEFADHEPEPHVALARVYRNQGETEKAIYHEDEAAALRRLESVYQTGVSLLEKKQYEDALLNLDAVIRERHDYRLALFYKGLALQLQGLHRESVPYYNKSLQVVPGYFQAHFNLGYALMKTGDLPRAIENFKKTLAVNPDYEEARRHLEWCRKEVLEKTED